MSLLQHAFAPFSAAEVAWYRVKALLRTSIWSLNEREERVERAQVFADNADAAPIYWRTIRQVANEISHRTT